VEIPDLLDYILLLLLRQFRIDGNCQGFFRSVLGFGQIAFSISEILKAFLEVQRYGVVDLSPHTVGVEEFSEPVPVPLGYPDDVLIKDMSIPLLDGRQLRTFRHFSGAPPSIFPNGEISR